MDLATLTIARAREGLRTKTFSCAELLDAYLDRLHACEPGIRAFLCVADEAARAHAKHVDALIHEGEELPPLAGIPVAVKDTIATRDLPTTAASKILSGYTPPYDATAVARLRAAHAVIIGKTNCDEFAMGASGEHSAFHPTKNPWAHDRVPGGSSSGSAAAVAAGAALAALGSDTGGSIRQPAGFCGLVGIKGTYGRVSRYGLFALASSLDQIGPLARTVEDAAVMLNAIGGHDPNDATTVEMAPMDLAAIRAADVNGIRIGIPKEYFVTGMDANVEAAVRSAADALAKLGATIQEISLPHTAYALAVYYILQPAEASSNLARYDGIRYGRRANDASTLLDTYGRSRDQGFGDEVKRRIMLGTYALSAGYYDAYYRKAQKVRTLIRRDFNDAFRTVDCILTPTSPSLPFSLGERYDDPITMYLSDIFTVPANIAGLPGISVPVGSSGGLPIGAQLMGPLWSEERLCTAANALERSLSLPLRLPDTNKT
jgi:aspartyl-tRNA(Asn)/glutamyl-tRNA(Gln) amidotransferase subunit A